MNETNYGLMTTEQRLAKAEELLKKAVYIMDGIAGGDEMLALAKTVAPITVAAVEEFWL